MKLRTAHALKSTCRQITINFPKVCIQKIITEICVIISSGTWEHLKHAESSDEQVAREAPWVRDWLELTGWFLSTRLKLERTLEQKHARQSEEEVFGDKINKFLKHGQSCTHKWNYYDSLNSSCMKLLITWKYEFSKNGKFL